MSDYIEREAAIAYIHEQSEECQKAFEELGGESGIYADAYNDLAEDFYRIPAADVVPVVHWIPVTEQLPESNHKNDHVGDVLCFVPPRDGCYQSGLYLGKPKHVAADDGSGNFWGRPMQASDWTLWSWIYLEKPVVTHWMPLPKPPKMDGGGENG
nr:MAG TPA: Protein of unknown function (DUF551) [Caudoviricetes sp.]